MFCSAFIPSLHQEILDFYEFMKPRPAEQNMRRDVGNRVKEVIVRLWPTAKVPRLLAINISNVFSYSH